MEIDAIIRKKHKKSDVTYKALNAVAIFVGVKNYEVAVLGQSATDNPIIRELRSHKLLPL